MVKNEEHVDFTAINADTPYLAALSLMDVFYTKEESLVMTSKKSSRPALPEDRMRKLIGMFIKVQLHHIHDV